jgi:hypothetical protein
MTHSGGESSREGDAPSFPVRVTLGTIFVYAALTLALIPVAHVPGPQLPGIIPLFVAGMLFAQLSTGFLLFVWFSKDRTWSLLLLGCAYLYSALMSLSHLLTFPGAILVDRPLIAASEQSTAWIFVAWTNGFGLLTLIATLIEARFSESRIVPNRVGHAVATALSAMMVTVLIVTIAVVKLEMPTLVTQYGFTALSWLVRWLSLFLLCSSIAVILLVMRAPSDLYLWLSWALTAMVFYTILSAIGGARFTLGWSIGRLSWFLSACVLFVYFLLQFARQFHGSPKDVTSHNAIQSEGANSSSLPRVVSASLGPQLDETP